MVGLKQVKISVAPELAESFKSACASAGVSMAAEISKYMLERIDALSDIARKNANKSNIDTRGKRRRHISLIVTQLEAIMERENVYMDNIPDNLKTSQAYENAEQSVDALEQAIEVLKEAY
jgi:flagellar biosynthesis chaperone FliJ